jgi:SAM-dependent methyltransferase
MHYEAYDWVARHATDDTVAVLDLGGRDINGSVRDLFPGADPYVSLDIADGPGVDVVADASTWTPDREYDVLVCCEVFEHTAAWPQICATAYKALRPGGTLILTMAGPGRPEHSAVDGGWVLHPGEHYGNVEPGHLLAVLEECGFANVTVDQQAIPADVRAYAVRP